MVRLENKVANLRPIAGTRRRDDDEAVDRALEEELLADPKERAEHLMLLDLGRNDVGRVAGPMTRIVDDAALMMCVLSKPDRRDGMSLLHIWFKRGYVLPFHSHYLLNLRLLPMLVLHLIEFKSLNLELLFLMLLCLI